MAWDGEQADRLPEIIENAHANGVDDIRALTRQQVFDREPALGPGVAAGVLVPGESIIFDRRVQALFGASQALDQVVVEEDLLAGSNLYRVVFCFSPRGSPSS